MLEERLTNLIAAVLRIPSDQISRDSDFVDDLGADSLALALIAARIEEELGVSLPADRLQHILSIRDLMEAIEDDV